MIKIISLLLWLSLLLALALLIFVSNGIRFEPETPLQHRALRAADLVRIEHLLQQNSASYHEPGQQMLRISQADLNLAANHFVGQAWRVGIAIHLQASRMTARTSWALPDNPFGRFFNISFDFFEQSGSLRLAGLSIGKLSLPVSIDYDFILRHLAFWLDRPAWAELSQRLQAVYLQAGALTLVYSDDAVAPAREAGSRSADAGVDYYHRQLAALLGRSPKTLGELLTPLFAAAKARSSAGQAVAENRALLIALGHYAAGQSVPLLLGRETAAARLPTKKVTLHGRWDLSRHFLISATISAAGSGQLSRVLGERKEISDSRGGSGFSFIDLAADRAGARFGASAVETEQTARRLQRQIASGLSDQDLLPAMSDFPEGLS